MSEAPVSLVFRVPQPQCVRDGPCPREEAFVRVRDVHLVSRRRSFRKKRAEEPPDRVAKLQPLRYPGAAVVLRGIHESVLNLDRRVSPDVSAECGYADGHG